MTFPPTSRYRDIETAKFIAADGRQFVYLQRRFLPDPRTIIVLEEYTVVEGDRLDNLTARFLGDPEQFWRVADANDEMHPDSLTAEIGAAVRIPLPQ